MPTYRLDIAYDGTDFAGWAIQPGERTVQGVLEEVLAEVLQEPVRLRVAGRTDAGVHAIGQVASFTIEREFNGELQRALNGLTDRDLAINGVAVVPDGFDARRDATSRRYRYRLETSSVPSPFERNRALWWPYPCDRELLDGCATALRGVHDFTAFTPTDTRHRHFNRAIADARWEREAERDSVLAFEIEADAFLRGMVRAVVGTMLEVAGGKLELSEFERLLTGASRPEAGDSAAACGLYLLRVGYER